jgi:hypothetical protein
MTRVHISTADVLRVLDGGRRLTLAQLMSKFGVTSPTTLNIAIKELISAGELMRRREHMLADGILAGMSYVYYTSEAIPVGRPYHNMRLTECLVGYESTMRRHADLCMVTRGAA